MSRAGYDDSSPITPGSPLARALDDFAVPELSAGFADKVLAAAEARPAPLPELRRSGAGRATGVFHRQDRAGARQRQRETPGGAVVMQLHHRCHLVGRGAAHQGPVGAGVQIVVLEHGSGW